MQRSAVTREDLTSTCLSAQCIFTKFNNSFIPGYKPQQSSETISEIIEIANNSVPKGTMVLLWVRLPLGVLVRLPFCGVLVLVLVLVRLPSGGVLVRLPAGAGAVAAGFPLNCQSGRGAWDLHRHCQNLLAKVRGRSR